MPLGGVEVFGTVSGSVPLDAQFHQLLEPAGVPPLSAPPLYRLRLTFLRVEWQTLDFSVPPPLTLSVLVNGQTTLGVSALQNIVLEALAIGPPALELNIFADVEPGASVGVFVRNTSGIVNPHLVSAYLHGWAYPQTLPDGAAYGGE